MSMHSGSRSGVVGIVMAAMMAAALSTVGAGPGGSAVKVTIEDDKPVVVEAALPVDPRPRVRYTPSTKMNLRIRDEQNRTLHLSHYPVLKIDDRVLRTSTLGIRFEKNNLAFSKKAAGRLRQGHESVLVHEDLRVTMTSEVAVSRPAPGSNQRSLGTVLIRYSVENIGKQPRTFGLRAYIDMYIVNNDGALFAAPTMPGKVLDGVELKGKTLPDYVQCLQMPNVKTPGEVAHLTLNLGGGIDKADRVVLSRHGAGNLNAWDMPAVRAGGDSALAIFFEPRQLKPGGRRELGYAYGPGVAVPPESEGRVEVKLDGSFEPGREFTVTAQIHDPVPAQTLILELPDGIELVEGREIQPVPEAPAAAGAPLLSFVQWRCTIRELGRHRLRLRSSTGVTQTKILTVSR
jgi:hypothetical protein